MLIVLATLYGGAWDNATYATYFTFSELLPLVLMLVIFEGSKKSAEKKASEKAAQSAKAKQLVHPADSDTEWAPSPSYHALEQAHAFQFQKENENDKEGSRSSDDSSYFTNTPDHDTTSSPYSYYYDDEPRSSAVYYHAAKKQHHHHHHHHQHQQPLTTQNKNNKYGPPLSPIALGPPFSIPQRTQGPLQRENSDDDDFGGGPDHTTAEHPSLVSVYGDRMYRTH